MERRPDAVFFTTRSGVLSRECACRCAGPGGTLPALMSLALLDLYLALELKGFSQWDGRTKALVCIIGGVILLVLSIALVRKIGVLAIAVPSVIIGALFIMNKNSGCLESATDVQEEGAYQKKKAKQAPAQPAPAPAPAR